MRAFEAADGQSFLCVLCSTAARSTVGRTTLVDWPEADQAKREWWVVGDAVFSHSLFRWVAVAAAVVSSVTVPVCQCVMPSVACSSLAIERIRDPAGQSACEAAKARGRSEAVAPVARPPRTGLGWGPPTIIITYEHKGSLASLAPGFISAALLLGCHRPSVVLVSGIVQAGKWQAAARNKNRKEAQPSVRDAKNARCKDVSVRRMRNFPLALGACASERNREGKKADLDAQWVTTTDRRLVQLN